MCNSTYLPEKQMLMHVYIIIIYFLINIINLFIFRCQDCKVLSYVDKVCRFVKCSLDYVLRTRNQLYQFYYLFLKLVYQCRFRVHHLTKAIQICEHTIFMWSLLQISNKLKETLLSFQCLLQPCTLHLIFLFRCEHFFSNS